METRKLYGGRYLRKDEAFDLERFKKDLDMFKVSVEKYEADGVIDLNDASSASTIKQRRIGHMFNMIMRTYKELELLRDRYGFTDQIMTAMISKSEDKPLKKKEE